MRNETPVVIPKRQDWRKLAPGLIVSAIAVIAILYFIDLKRLSSALLKADYRYIVLFFGISISWLAVRGLVWRTLLQEQASFSQVFLTLNEGYLLNNILPFRLGELGRAFLLSKKASLGFLQVFSTILIERALDVAFAAGLLFATLPFVMKVNLAWQAAVTMGSLVLVGLVLLYLLARNQSGALKQFDRLANRFPELRRLIGQQQLTAFFTGLGSLTDGKRFLKVILLMLLNWGIALLQFFILLRGYLPDAQLLWAAFTMAVMALGVAAPSSPGAVGVLEASVIGALSVFGLDPSVTLAVALTAHLGNYLTTGLIGAYALARDGQSLAGLYRDVRKISFSSPSSPGKPE
jgi:glycosyltransferase 2 family protein